MTILFDMLSLLHLLSQKCTFFCDFISVFWAFRLFSVLCLDLQLLLVRDLFGFRTYNLCRILKTKTGICSVFLCVYYSTYITHVVTTLLQAAVRGSVKSSSPNIQQVSFFYSGACQPCVNRPIPPSNIEKCIKRFKMTRCHSMSTISTGYYQVPM